MIVGVISACDWARVTGRAGLSGCPAGHRFRQQSPSHRTIPQASPPAPGSGAAAPYLISRSRRGSYGSAIRPVFYLALAASVALYARLHREPCCGQFPTSGLPPRECASLVNLLVFASVFIGARWTIRIRVFHPGDNCAVAGSRSSGAQSNNFSLARLEKTSRQTIRTMQPYSRYLRCFPRGHRHHGGRKYPATCKTPAAPFRAGTLIAIAIRLSLLPGRRRPGGRSTAARCCSKNSFVMGSSAAGQCWWWPV